jgi:predicted nucleotidyltransferase
MSVLSNAQAQEQSCAESVVGERMKPSEALDSHRDAIRRVVASHRACNARVFGSVLHGNDTTDSDLDILIDPTPETTLFDIGAIRHELGQLLGLSVDVLTPNALPDKFRAAVLAEARPV